jgi:hypothetical protein
VLPDRYKDQTTHQVYAPDSAGRTGSRLWVPLVVFDDCPVGLTRWTGRGGPVAPQIPVRPSRSRESGEL